MGSRHDPSVAITGTVTVDEPVTVDGTVTATGPLTDAQLRATAVPISGTVSVTEPVTVDGTVAVSGTVPVSVAATLQVDVTDEPTRDLGKVDVASFDQYTPVAGRLPIDGSGVTQPVSGPLTDTQLRATPVPISGTVSVTEPVTVDGTVTANPTTAFGKTITYVSVNQSAAGTTQLAAASVGNKHKIVGAMLVISLLGTLKFTDGVGDLTGPMDIAANGGFVLGGNPIPYLETAATNRALNLVTTLGAARGVVSIITEA